MQNKIHTEKMQKEKKLIIFKWLLFGCGGCLLTIILFWIILVVAWNKYFDYVSISNTLSKIKPGISYNEIKKNVPKRFITDYYDTQEFHEYTFIVSNNVKCASVLRLDSIDTFPLFIIEEVNIYFDSDTNVVGIYYGYGYGVGKTNSDWQAQYKSGYYDE